MRSETHPPRVGYRVPSRGGARLTVITVRPSEFAAPRWLQRLAEGWRLFRDGPRGERALTGSSEAATELALRAAG